MRQLQLLLVHVVPLQAEANVPDHHDAAPRRRHAWNASETTVAVRGRGRDHDGVEAEPLGHPGSATAGSDSPGADHPVRAATRRPAQSASGVRIRFPGRVRPFDAQG